MKNGSRNHMGIYTIAIVGLFLAGFFMLLVFGAKVYQGTVGIGNDNRDERAVLAYIQTIVKDNDTEGAVKVTESDSGRMLVISDGSTGYALKIYSEGGKILEEFGKEDSTPDPSNAQVIGETEVFELEMPEKDVLKVNTDEGSVFVRIRSGEGDEA